MVDIFSVRKFLPRVSPMRYQIMCHYMGLFQLKSSGSQMTVCEWGGVGSGGNGGGGGGGEESKSLKSQNLR